MLPVPKRFYAEEFTPYADPRSKVTAEDKAEAANRLADFIEKRCPKTLYTYPIYESLYLHLFGHCAEGHKDNSYESNFTTPQKRWAWLKTAMDHTVLGDATHTYIDVEEALKAWIIAEGLDQFYRNEAEEQERRDAMNQIHRLMESLPEADRKKIIKKYANL